MTQSDINSAFQDTPVESQQVFRSVMNAMAQPGIIARLDSPIIPPAPLNPAATAILLALADFETSVWLDAAVWASLTATDYIRFHSGAKLTAETGEASFALITDAEHAPALSSFAQGTPDFPDRSTTLILQVSGFSRSGWTLTGPGIETETQLGAWPLPPGFKDQIADNRRQFPLGVDLVFASADSVAALPRSTHVEESA